MPPVKVTHGLIQGAMTAPRQPFGDKTPSRRPSSAGRVVTVSGQTVTIGAISQAERVVGGYVQTVRRPSLLAYAGYEDRVRRTSCSNAGDIMVPKAVNSIRSQVEMG
eukprot:s1928_g1.t1